MWVKLKYIPTEKTDAEELRFRLGQTLCMIHRVVDVTEVAYSESCIGVNGVSKSDFEAISSMLKDTLVNNNCEVT